MKTYLFKLFLSIIFITCSFTLIAQDYSLYKLYVDSLKPTLAAAPNDTNKVEFYFSIAGFYQWSDSDSSLLYSLPGIDLAKKLNFKNGEYDLLHSAFQALLTKGNYSKALEFQFRSMDIANQLKDPTKIATTLALIGLVYTNSKDYDKALEYFYKAQKMNVLTLGGPQILNGFIGEAYFDLHNWDSALVYIQRAYELDLKDTGYHWSEPYFYLAKDNGNGIPQKIVDKIFQPFFTTKPTGSGTGLGLSLSYDIIKAHGGEIKVETKEGEGSEFVIQLPIA